nr:retrovirus-related Pol polyprotein from transposon TNT 1-94 [Tanacetum cinerariifolium]
MAKATPTQAWLWHQRLSHLNFDYINLLSKKDIVIGLPKLKYVKDQLCSSCELSKAKKSSFKSKVVPSSKGRLNLLHMDLCGPMRVASINGKKYILVIVDDYSRYTWTFFLRSKDETPEVLKDFLTMIQRNLQAQTAPIAKSLASHISSKGISQFGAIKIGASEDPPEDPPEVSMADNQTMAELLQAPTEGYEDAIVILEIAANNFELKHGLINLVQSKQFFRHDKEDPHAHIRYFNKITSMMRVPNVPTGLRFKGLKGGQVRSLRFSYNTFEEIAN